MRRFAFLLFLAVAWCVAASPAKAAKVIALPLVKTWTGDLDGMLDRRVVRILVPPSVTTFFLSKGAASGVTAELGQALQVWLNKRYAKKGYPIYVALIPAARDKIFDDLVAGKGDIAAGNLTITEERQGKVDFAAPWASDIREVLVTGPAAPQLTSINDLAGREVAVRRSSSFHTHLVALNEKFKAEGRAPIVIHDADENLENEDLLQMVSAGLLPWTFVDSHVAAMWTKFLKGLVVRDDIVINTGGEIAWAIRKNSPGLAKELAAFVKEHGLTTPQGSDIRFRYFTDARTVKNALSADGADTLKGMMGYFQTYGERFRISPYLVAAQGYQESTLNQSLRMKSGAVGVMQIKPTTAREKEIGINDVVSSAESNIHAGAKYVRFLADKYINDPNVDDFNRVLMALAAYNAGPGSLKKFRETAAKQGFNPNIWFRNVEFAAAALGKYETVQYVGNVYKYYIAYSLLLKQSAAAKP